MDKMKVIVGDGHAARVEKSRHSGDRIVQQSTYCWTQPLEFAGARHHGRGASHRQIRAGMQTGKPDRRFLAGDMPSGYRYNRS
jgi:hypothetical protein